MQSRMNNPQDTIDFEAIFLKEVRPLGQYVSMRVSNQDDAQDVAAEAMCQTIAYCKRGETTVKNPRALLYKIARNRLADYYESRTVRATEISLEDAPQLEAPHPVDDTVALREDVRIVRSALTELNDAYREVITLHAIVGLSIGEIADMMEKRPATIRMTLMRARRAIRLEVAKQEQAKRGASHDEQAGTTRNATTW
jgi:RNA polymerase sigma-70 factor, ECF subfamily